MSLSALLVKLKPLLGNPTENFAHIVELLEDHRELAEYEVARYWVSRTMMPSLVENLRSPHPLERRRAAGAIHLISTRNRAAQLLRSLVKDADLGVRARARHAVVKLGIDEVALRDTRRRLPRRVHRTAVGGWNPTGWSFGLFAEHARANSGRTTAPTRATLLERYKLPALQTGEELSRWLGFKKTRELQRFLRPGSGPGSPYIDFEIPKSSGEPRKITAPRAALKRLQRRILTEILDKLPLHSACHGFVRGRSVKTNAAPHEGAELVIKMDLRDFFPTIHYRRVWGLFWRIGYREEVAAMLASLVTHRDKLADGTVVWPGRLPQGAPTSPALANLLCRRLDARLSGLAKRAGATYTRYADDLTFSFRKTSEEKGIGRFLWWVDQVCQQEGFIENTAKRRILWGSNQQRVTGVVVNSGLHIPREARRQFRALLHNCKKDGIDAQARGHKNFRAYLLGFASYVKMVEPALGKKYLTEVRALLKANPKS